ncbi:MAG TPA: hypothetical protein VF778_04820 [Xanthobacteraceae bacterium]
MELSADERVCQDREGYGIVAGRLAMRYFASDTVTLQSMVARLNIELFCKKLSEEMNEAKRRTLLQLVAEEKAKLSALVATAVA